MRQLILAVTLSFITLWLTGCGNGSISGPKPTTDTSVGKPSPPPPPPPRLSPVGTTGSPPKAQTAAQPQASSTIPGVSKPQTATEGQQAIRVSTGVALPQTGPDGTLMSFSVDYEFTQGEPGSSAYIWVIERAHGGPARQPVQLARQGNLPILIQGWHPEDGPFQTHIEDRSGNRLSAVIDLR